MYLHALYRSVVQYKFLFCFQRLFLLQDNRVIVTSSLLLPESLFKRATSKLYYNLFSEYPTHKAYKSPVNLAAVSIYTSISGLNVSVYFAGTAKLMHLAIYNKFGTNLVQPIISYFMCKICISLPLQDGGSLLKKDDRSTSVVYLLKMVP